MADSDNNMTLPYVTRRMVLAGMAFARSQSFESVGSDADHLTDPVIPIWYKWRAVLEQIERLCLAQQYLERRLVETVGFPCVVVHMPNGKEVRIHSLDALRALPVLDSEDAIKRAKAEHDLSIHLERWDAAASAIGYSATLKAEREAGNRAHRLLIELCETPAVSLGGVAAKLDAVLSEGEASEKLRRFPWAQIHSALEDILRLDLRIK